MASLTYRLTRLENGQVALPCPDPWHQPLDALAVRTVDYRRCAAPLAPGYREPTTEPPPDSCRTCGEERLSITITAVAPGAVLPGARA